MCFTLADAPVWFPALAQMQRLVASQLGYAVGINHISQIFLCKDRESLFSDWWGDRGNCSVLRIAMG